MATRRTTLGDKPSNKRITFDINSTPDEDGLIASSSEDCSGSSSSEDCSGSSSSEDCSGSSSVEGNFGSISSEEGSGSNSTEEGPGSICTGDGPDSKSPEGVRAGLLPANPSLGTFKSLRSGCSPSPDISSREKSISWFGSSSRAFRLRAISSLKRYEWNIFVSCFASPEKGDAKHEKQSIGEQGIILHRRVHFLANTSNHLLVFRRVEHLLNQFGDEHHQVFLGTTGGEGGSA